ncbi:hypothetical protein RM704_34530 [Streptomyces sp. DSM 3412]|uniref:Uncharacterized protein n=1 Tax=Streptomyces gottesmaniae TaxID=3075518 RepID=A0ABU2Z7W9_9ACTN|nr:hypothetical protein [Streptomyces sp. DSM 3412]MDT0572521.1 hypothetical protein [Streptomyces sp. DSM 3412]
MAEPVELTIALEEGFEGQHVVVVVDGDVVLDDPEVRTRRQIGLARSVPVRLPEGEHAIGVLVDGVERLNIRVDSGAVRWAGISRDADGSLDVVTGSGLRGYA